MATIIDNYFLKQEYGIYDAYKNIYESRETLLFLLIKGNSLPGKQNKLILFRRQQRQLWGPFSKLHVLLVKTLKDVYINTFMIFWFSIGI